MEDVKWNVNPLIVQEVINHLQFTNKPTPTPFSLIKNLQSYPFKPSTFLLSLLHYGSKE